ncbi:LysE family translocator [Rugamonas rubra]|uniref:Leucine efflux protein n=1 Tax=Rugamonas rubra TaxID=758825 RepID=A0A1I4SF40_9BURK|nr:LysE family translocator [Rugamonas rubra]SFM62994.1 leucine efflux protein [Rugamonas rubra]
MMSLTQLLPFVLASALVIGVPGPATFFVLGQARISHRRAASATLGIVLGDVLLMTASALGFAALVTRWPLLLLAVKLAGAIFLLYLAWGLWGGASPAGQVAQGAAGGSRGFVKGVLLTVFNPKPVLFFAAFFPQFMPEPTTAPLQGFAALGLVFELLNLAYFAALVALLTVAGNQRGFQSFLKGNFNRVAAVGLLLCSGLTVASLL